MFIHSHFSDYSYVLKMYFLSPFSLRIYMLYISFIRLYCYSSRWYDSVLVALLLLLGYTIHYICHYGHTSVCCGFQFAATRYRVKLDHCWPFLAFFKWLFEVLFFCHLFETVVELIVEKRAFNICMNQFGMLHASILLR